MDLLYFSVLWMIIQLDKLNRDNCRSGGCSDSADEALPLRAHLPREMPSAGHVAQKPSSEVDQDDVGDDDEGDDDDADQDDGDDDDQDDGGDGDEDDGDEVDQDGGGDPTHGVDNKGILKDGMNPICRKTRNTIG